MPSSAGAKPLGRGCEQVGAVDGLALELGLKGDVAADADALHLGFELEITVTDAQGALFEAELFAIDIDEGVEPNIELAVFEQPFGQPGSLKIEAADGQVRCWRGPRPSRRG